MKKIVGAAFEQIGKEPDFGPVFTIKVPKQPKWILIRNPLFSTYNETLCAISKNPWNGNMISFITDRWDLNLKDPKLGPVPTYVVALC